LCFSRPTNLLRQHAILLIDVLERERYVSLIIHGRRKQARSLHYHCANYLHHRCRRGRRGTALFGLCSLKFAPSFQPPLFWSRSNSPAETTVDIPEVPSVPPSPLFKLPSYTPPDALMFPLISAIERKAWLQARQLSRELLLYDIDRRSYRELFARLDKIINLIDQRLRPRSVFRETSTAKTGFTGRSSPKRPV
jgi:hypothetical protein